VGKTIAEKLIAASLVDGEMVRGQRIGIRADQTLSHDVNGVMSYLAFEALGLDKVKVDLRPTIRTPMTIAICRI